MNRGSQRLLAARGGVTASIAGDYREATGWVWKLLPLRRTDLAQN